MRKIWNWLFRKSNERSYWTVACQSKWTDSGVTVDSFVSSHLFEKWTDAARFADRLAKKSNSSLNVLGVVEIKTTLPLSYTRIHYEIENEYGQCQVSYYWPEGVGYEQQKAAEGLKEKTINEIKQKAREVPVTPERKPAQKRRPRQKKA